MSSGSHELDVVCPRRSERRRYPIGKEESTAADIVKICDIRPCGYMTRPVYSKWVFDEHEFDERIVEYWRDVRSRGAGVVDASIHFRHKPVGRVIPWRRAAGVRIGVLKCIGSIRRNGLDDNVCRRGGYDRRYPSHLALQRRFGPAARESRQS